MSGRLSTRLFGAALMLILALAIGGSASAETLFVNDFDHVRGYDTASKPATATVQVGDAEIGSARNVAVGPDGKLYVVDQGTSFDKTDILKFEPDGTALGNWSPATGLSGIQKMIFGPGGDLFVVDTNANPIGVYRFDGTTGVAKGLYTKGVTLTFPFGIAFDDQGRLYLSDPVYLASRLIRYDATGNYEATLLQHKSIAPADLINFPRGLCLGSDKALYIVDHFDEAVYRYDPAADSIALYATITGSSPQDCAFGDDGTLYVDAFSPHGILPIAPPVGNGSATVGDRFATDLPGHRNLAISTATLTGPTTTSTSTTSTTEVPGICGDANDDGKINASDALKVLRGAVGSLICPPILCDTDHSGKVTATDAVRVLKKAVGVVITLICS